ncbi:phosphotransferase family protein [Candidatus Poriferisocius sp.]|uniref:phosphotransferase family protein n=1 Tax=Candidatus Poriferisocius sp. TaxID=3101276 RepID=UPI003B029D06
MAIPQDRDIEALKAVLSDWMNTQPGVSGAEVTRLVNPEASGFSNETLVCDAVWTANGQSHDSGIVVRKRPTNYAIFPTYDMSVQYRSMQNMAACGAVPVPEVLWVENTGTVMGEPFFVMERLHGRVPTDNPPFFQEGWVREATPDQQSVLYESSIDTLAAVSATDWRATGFDFLDLPRFGPLGFAQQLGYQRFYADWAAEGRPKPLIDAALDWFDANDPSGSMPIELNWGDARPSNIMYGEDFRVMAVFDWEMADLGPGEVDLGWFLFMNRYLSEGAGIDWLPGFTDRAGTIARWERKRGRPAEHMNYFEAWGCLRFSIIMVAIVNMQVKYGYLSAEDGAQYERVNPSTQMLAGYLNLPDPK